MSDEMVWEDPPVYTGRGWMWTKPFADACKAHPGKWAAVIAPNGRKFHGQGTRTSLRKHGLEVKMTSKDEDGALLPNGQFRFWARWPGE